MQRAAVLAQLDAVRRLLDESCPCMARYRAWLEARERRLLEQLAAAEGEP